MRNNRVVRYIFLTLSVLTMAVIFLFSAQTKTQSGAISEGFSAFWKELLSNVVSEEFLAWLVEYVRQGAHVFLYAVLGTFVSLTVLTFDFGKGWWLYLSLPLAVCLVYACLDEIHQVFVDGRCGQIRDVLIDAIGFSTATALTNLLYCLFSGIRKKK